MPQLVASCVEDFTPKRVAARRKDIERKDEERKEHNATVGVGAFIRRLRRPAPDLDDARVENSFGGGRLCKDGGRG